MRAPARLFDDSYEERVRLDDGRRLTLRPVRPEDSHLLVDGLARMSAESRYMRFMAARSHLDDKTLRYLCEVDGTDHFALGVEAARPDGTTEGAAVARFVRLADTPEVADLAITVVDDYQARGLGRLLLARMVAAARERGIARFRCDYFKSNEKVRRLLAVLETHAVLDDEGDSLTVELLLPPPTLAERVTGSLGKGPLASVVRAVAGLAPRGQGPLGSPRPKA